jgi:RNA polymerase sigma-70 factor (ECF subfamily)
MSDLTPEQFIKLVEDKDSNEWRILFKKWSSYVFAIALRMTHKIELAEDVVSEVFEKLWDRLYTLRSTGSYKAFLAAITVNASKAILTDEKKHRYISIEQTEFDLECKSTSMNPEHRLELEVLSKKIDNYISRLRGNQREYFELYYYGKLSAKEITKLVQGEKSKSTAVGSTLSQAKNSLKEMLKNDPDITFNF